MRTFLTPDPVTLEIRNATGEVHIDLTDTTTTTVELVATRSSGFGRWDDMVGELFRSLSRGSWDPSERSESSDSDPVDLARVEYQDTRGTVVVDTDPAQRLGKTAFTIRVTAPLASGVRVRAESSDVTLSGSASRAEVKTTAGDVVIDTVIGPAVVQTASGTVRVRTATAGADLRTTSGTLELDEVRERAQLHTTSGTVIVGTAHDDLSVRSVSGDVRIGSCRAGISDITSVSGAVSVGIDTGVTARLDVTTITGRATAEFDVLDSDPGSAASAAPAGASDSAAADEAGSESADSDAAGSDSAAPDSAASNSAASDSAALDSAGSDSDPAGVTASGSDGAGEDSAPTAAPTGKDAPQRSSLALSVTTTSGDIRVHAA